MRIKSILICLLSVIGIMGVDASSLEITGGKDKIKTNEEVKFEIKLSDVKEDKFNLVEFDIEYNKDLIEFTGGTTAEYNTKEVYSGNSAFITVSTDSFKDGVITSFKLKNLTLDNGNTSFKIKNVKFKNGDTEVGKMDTEVSKTINLVHSTTTTTTTTTAKPKNTSAKVTSITFKNATMKPAFDPSKKEYKLYTKDTIRRLTLLYETEQTGVVLKGECTLGCTMIETSDNKGIVGIEEGKNEVTFTFTSEDGTNTETYKFIIYRGETTDGSNKLSALSVKEFNINEEFDNETLDYTISVPFETEKLEVTATPEDENAEVKVKGADKLEVGENTITITVTPTDEEEDIKIYNITVTRQEFVEEEPTTSAVVTTGPEDNGDKDKKNNNILIIVLISVGTLIIGLSAYFIFFHKGKKKKGKKTDKIETLDMNETTELPKVREVNIIDRNFEEKEPTIEDALEDLMKTKQFNNDFRDDIYN